MARGKFHKPGSPSSHQLRVVCQTCNNGWMSDMQNAAISHLVPLLNGLWTDLDDEASLAVANYVTMVTLVLEFADTHTITATPEERAVFMRTKKPASNWQVLVGLYGDEEKLGGFWHRSARLSPVDLQSAFPTRNDTQTTSFHFGKSFFHAISAPKEYLPDPDEYASHLGIRRVWPTPRSKQRPPILFTQAGYDRVATAIWSEIEDRFEPLPRMSTR